MEKLGQYFVVVTVFCLVATFTSAETVASKTCSAQGTECKAIANSSCDGSHCKCDAAFKEGTSAAEGTCVPKAVSEIDCSTNATVCVTHSTCVGSGTKTCQCDSTYKEGTGTAINTCVPKASVIIAVSEIDCTADATVCVTHSTCVGSGPKKCQCDAAYQEGTGTSGNTCVPKASVIIAVSEIVCTTNATACVTHSTCVGSGPKKCQCDAAYNEGTGTAVNKCVPKGLSDSCIDTSDCIGVSNAACVDDAGRKKCTCKPDYKTENGQCNTANGLQTLLSAPVALLLSFLTIVVTRMH